MSCTWLVFELTRPREHRPRAQPRRELRAVYHLADGLDPRDVLALALADLGVTPPCSFFAEQLTLEGRCLVQAARSGWTEGRHRGVRRGWAEGRR